MGNKTCKIEGCGNNVHSREMCGKHYTRKRLGNPLITKRERFILDNKPSDGVGIIPLTRGYTAIVDEEDYWNIIDYYWQANFSKGKFVYATRNIVPTREKRKHEKMHRAILKPEPGQIVDHINGNGLDNRRCNIRLATYSQNKCNSIACNDKCSSRFRGVFVNNGSIVSQITKDGNKYHLGCYETEEDAAIVYNIAAQLLHGEFAYLNKI